MANTLLNSIQNPADLRKLSPEQLPQLAQELRGFIIDIVSVKEGHLGASLGVTNLPLPCIIFLILPMIFWFGM